MKARARAIEKRETGVADAEAAHKRASQAGIP
jgi:hypothetical protein